jgi:hypothetical protein
MFPDNTACTVPVQGKRALSGIEGSRQCTLLFSITGSVRESVSCTQVCKIMEGRNHELRNWVHASLTAGPLSITINAALLRTRCASTSNLLGSSRPLALYAGGESVVMTVACCRSADYGFIEALARPSRRLCVAMVSLFCAGNPLAVTNSASRCFSDPRKACYARMVFTFYLRNPRRPSS